MVLPVQNVGAGGFSGCSDLLDEVIWRSYFFQTGRQEFQDGVKVRVVQATLNEVGMPCAHVFSGVSNRSTEYHREEGLLFGDLPIHVHIIEEVTDAIVGQNLAVEDIYCGVNGGLTAKLFVERLSRSWLHVEICIQNATILLASQAPRLRVFRQAERSGTRMTQVVSI
jgi:hypothetical protein